MLFYKAVATFHTSLTNTLHYRDILERLPRKAALYLEPPSGKKRSFRVQVLDNEEFVDIGNIPSDISNKLLNEYATCKYEIKSHNVTFSNNGGVGCDVVLVVYKRKGDMPINNRTGMLLAIFLGWCGGYRFYKRQLGFGILYLCTFGLFGIGWIVDILSAINICKSVSPPSSTSETNDIV